MKNNPTAFISYTWESDDLKKWVKDLAIKLREKGIDVKLDQWEVVPGDQMPHFMEISVRENDFVLIICTPQYKAKSEQRLGGVGYEGDIMTAEVLQGSNPRKFIPIMKSGTKDTSLPSWLKGKYFVDLSTTQHFDNNFKDLLTTLLNARETAPALGRITPHLARNQQRQPEVIVEDENVRIKGILIDEVTKPINDGTAGSALYKIPFELNKQPTREWISLFINAWNRPPRFSTMHRPGIASVNGNRIILDGTEIEEVERYHKDTLKLAVGVANNAFRELNEKKKQKEEEEKRQQEAHKNKLDEISRRISFDE